VDSGVFLMDAFNSLHQQGIGQDYRAALALSFASAKY